MASLHSGENRVLSVSELTREARRVLETGFPMVWVEGELSNFARPGSGHWYFTLKDRQAQLRCAMFASRNRSVRFRPTEGAQVLIRGRVSLYEARGEFQIIVDAMEPAGEGALRAAYEALKAALEAEGLFAPERKTALPTLPGHIAVITSPTGAALRDILAVLGRRAPAVAVTVLPVAVQGRDAEGEINAAFARLAEWDEAALGPRPDVVLLARGGGSLEDLWAFNLESVARTIAACELPVVVGVGHESDVTIADFVADLRAPTPSAGAELIAPDLGAWLEQLRRLERSLRSQMHHRLEHDRARLRGYGYRLVHPGRALQQRMQRLDELERQLGQAMRRRLDRLESRFALLRLRLAQRHPHERFARARDALEGRSAALERVMARRLEGARDRLRELSRALHAVSPLDTLSRGYAIIMHPPPSGADWGTPITSVTAVRGGEHISAQLRDGRLDCVIETIHGKRLRDGSE